LPLDFARMKIPCLLADQERGVLCAVSLRLPIYLALTLLAVVTNYILGKEVGWDVGGYHLYAGFSAVNDRFAQDYFAAGPQAYFNPYALAPFYLLVDAGLPALCIASIMAAAQSAGLWFTFELGAMVCPSADRNLRSFVGVCAAIAAFVNPIFMQQLGSSFTDISTGAVVLAGWLLIASTLRSASSARTLCGGLLLGAAAALKLTNAVHAIAGLGVLLLLPEKPTLRLRHLIYCGIAMGAGFAIVAAPWSLRLERVFDNPLFPLMNGIFRSPEFTTETIRHFRFTPDSAAAALWRPFAILNPANMVQEELRAPDLRYAALIVVFTVLVSLRLWRRFGNASANARRGIQALSGSTRVLAALGVGLSIDWVLWLAGSGNGRYFLPAACLAGVVLVGLLFTALVAVPRIRNYALILLFGAQAMQLWIGTDYRWNAAPWGGPWFEVSMPAQLRTEPTLFLAIGGITNSFIAPYLAPGSGLVNIGGAYVLDAQGPSGARIKALEAHYGGRIRILIRGDALHEDAEKRSPLRSQMDAALNPFGLRVDKGNCATIEVEGLPPELTFTTDYGTSSEAASADKSRTTLVTCQVVPGAGPDAALMARRQSVDEVFDRMEDACPQLFQPRRAVSEYNGRVWSRHYTNTDIMAWISQGDVKFWQSDRGAAFVNVGREADWLKAPVRLECGRRNSTYYAHVVNPVSSD
jgi:hypothetical protein